MNKKSVLNMKSVLIFIVVSILIFFTNSNTYFAAKTETLDEAAKMISEFTNEFTLRGSVNTETFYEELINSHPYLILTVSSFKIQSSLFETKVNVEYKNTDIKKSDIIIIDSKDELYGVVENAMLYCKERLLVCVYDPSDKNIYLNEIVNSIRKTNHLAYMGYKEYRGTTYKNENTDYVGLDIRFSYSFATGTLLEMKKELEKTVAEISELLYPPHAPDYYKEKVIHDYIVENTRYSKDDPLYSGLAYGTLIKGESVCEGYTQAFRLMLNYAGIENIVIYGQAGGELHSWNIVNIQGENYHVDVTWDDPDTKTALQILRHDYFNQTDSIMAADHSWERSEYPECTSYKYSFRTVNRLIKAEPKYEIDMDKTIEYTSVFSESDIPLTANLSMVKDRVIKKWYQTTPFEVLVGGVFAVIVLIMSIIIVIGTRYTGKNYDEYELSDEFLEYSGGDGWEKDDWEEE